MAPILSIFAAVMIGFSYPGVVRSSVPPDVPGALLGILLAGLFARINGLAAARRAAGPGRSPAAIMIRAAAVSRGMAVLCYAFVVYGCHWPAVVPTLGIDRLVLFDDLVLLAPFAMMLTLVFVCQHAAESRVKLHNFSRADYVAFQWRQVLLPSAPFLIFVCLSDLLAAGSRAGIRPFAEASFAYGAYPFVQWLTLAAVLYLLYCALPFFLRFLWRAYPLPDGQLRRRLLAYSERVGFRARDILVWPTQQNLINAAVIGPAAPFRYVLLTDALIDALPEDEIEAIFAHEAGHARHRHMPLFFLFTVGYTLLAFLLGTWAEKRLFASVQDPTLYYLGFALVTFLMWFGTLFGFLSRRFEQQADVFGATTVGGEGVDPAAHPFVRALAGLARQMGDLREVKGWRHFSLGARIEFLTRYLADPATRRRYRRGSAALFGFFALLLLSIAAAAASTLPAQLREGRPAEALLRADWLSSHGKDDEAVAEGLHALDVASQAGLPLVTGALRGIEKGPRERALRLNEWISRGPAAEPRWSRVLNLTLLSRALLTVPEPRMAFGAAEAAIELGGNHPVTIEDAGTALLLLGRLRGARLAFADAIALSPAGSPRAHRLAGWTKAIDAITAAARAPSAETWKAAEEAAKASGFPVSIRVVIPARHR